MPGRLRSVLGVALAVLLLAGCGTEEEFNNRPTMPDAPVGPAGARANTRVVFAASATDPDGEQVCIRMDWGDGTFSEWSALAPGGTLVTHEHYYFTGGAYHVRAIARDARNLESIPSGAATIVVTGTGVAGRGEWWMFGRDALHRGQSGYPGPELSNVLWTYAAANRIYGGAVLAIDSTVYFACDDFRLHAVFPDGRRRWTYDVGSDWVRSTPAIAPDGTIYVAATDGILHAVAPNGARKWVYVMEPGGQFSSPAIAPDGTVYIGAHDGSLHAVTPGGVQRWRHLASAPIESSPAITPDGTIVFGCDNHVIYAVAPDGSLRWSYPTQGPVRSSATIASDGTVIIGSDDTYLYAIRDGNLRWKYKTPDAIVSRPAIDMAGNIYVASMDGSLHALTGEGQVRWTLRYAGFGGASSAALDVNGVIYLGTRDHTVLAITPDGRELWRAYVGGECGSSSPVIAPGGRLYIGCFDGRLYCIGR